MIESKSAGISIWNLVRLDDERVVSEGYAVELGYRGGGGFSNQTQFSAGSRQSDAVESLGARA